MRSINALSSSSILISTTRRSLMTLLKKFRYSNTIVPSFLHGSCSCFLRYNLLERLFVIYNVSNLDPNHVAVSSSIMLYIISSARHSWIVFAALDPSPLNSRLTYLKVLLNFPTRYCEDHVTPVMSSLSFALNRSFLYH